MQHASVLQCVPTLIFLQGPGATESPLLPRGGVCCSCNQIHCCNTVPPIRQVSSDAIYECLLVGREDETRRCMLQCIAVWYSVLQCVAVCCNVLQCVAMCCSVLKTGQDVACCSMLQYVAVCCSVLQCVAVCCSVLKTEQDAACLKTTHFDTLQDVTNSHCDTHDCNILFRLPFPAVCCMVWYLTLSVLRVVVCCSMM